MLARYPAPAATGHYRGGQIAQYPRTCRLDRVDVCRRKEEFGEDVASGFVIEKREQGPVNKPGTVVELRERVVE